MRDLSAHAALAQLQARLRRLAEWAIRFLQSHKIPDRYLAIELEKMAR